MLLYSKRLKIFSSGLHKTTSPQRQAAYIEPAESFDCKSGEGMNGAGDDRKSHNATPREKPLIEATIVEVDSATGGPKARRECFYRGAWHAECSHQNFADKPAKFGSQVVDESSSHFKMLDGKQKHRQSRLAIKRVLAKTDLRYPNDKAFQTDESLIVPQLNKSTSTEGLIPDTVLDELEGSASFIQIKKKRSAALEQLCYTLSLYDVAPEKLARGLELVLQEDKRINKSRQWNADLTKTSSNYDSPLSTLTSPTPSSSYCDASVKVLRSDIDLLPSSKKECKSNLTLLNQRINNRELLSRREKLKNDEKPKFENLKEEYEYLMRLPRGDRETDLMEAEKVEKDETSESHSVHDLEESPTVSTVTHSYLTTKIKELNYDEGKVDEPRCLAFKIKDDTSAPSKDKEDRPVKGHMYVSAGELTLLKASLDAIATNCVPVTIIRSPASKKRYAEIDYDLLVESDTYIPIRRHL